jgi:putative ABC transport system substrate-binding protein
VTSRRALSNRQSARPLIGRRRCIVAALSGVPGLQLGWTSAAAQKVYCIGVLDPDAEASNDTWNEFVTELNRRGYEEGKNLVFERRFSDERRVDLLNRNAIELADLRVDVIYAVEGTLSALAAKKATRTVPIVFNTSGDPVAFGVVQSLSHPGGNVTGSAISSFDTIPKSLQMLIEATGRRDLRIAAPMPRH